MAKEDDDSNKTISEATRGLDNLNESLKNKGQTERGRQMQRSRSPSRQRSSSGAANQRDQLEQVPLFPKLDSSGGAAPAAEETEGMAMPSKRRDATHWLGLRGALKKTRKTRDVKFTEIVMVYEGDVEWKDIPKFIESCLEKGHEYKER